MESAYIVEPGCYLRKNGHCLVIFKQGNVIESLPLQGLKRLVFTGNQSLTGGVMDWLIHHRVETVFLSITGRFRARLMVDEHKHVSLRKAQYLKLSDADFQLKTMKIIVSGKLKNMAAFLAKRGRNYKISELKTCAAAIRSLSSSLERAKDPAAVRGIEGAGSRLYFQAFSFLLRNDQFSFTHRNRRPPLDPVNALLSFVYTLLTNEVTSAIQSWGLDPYLGALHEISYGRPSLSCDLVEEYRSPIADRFVLGLLNRKMIHTHDFIFRNTSQKAFVSETEMAKKRPVEMKPCLYTTFLRAYEEMMQGPSKFRRTIHNQIRAFGEYLQHPDECPYVPFFR